jgi:hypothetical protein
MRIPIRILIIIRLRWDLMTYRNKVYIAFDGDNDMHYYNLLEAWNANPNFDFRFANAHDLNTA